MEVYNDYIAKHYQAYRPPLHRLILSKVLVDKHFKRGLDVGCGTGQSSIALSEFCDEVNGIDSSESMLKNSLDHPRVSYQSTELKLEESFDLICYFGSLNYIKKDEVKEHLAHLNEGGMIICCDFQLLFEKIHNYFSIELQASGYNHKKNLNFYGLSNIIQQDSKTNLEHFSCTHEELTHLLLSDHQYIEFFQEYFKEADPFNQLKEALLNVYPNDVVWISTVLYFISYRSY